MTFTHFPKETFQYLKDLSANNSKDWFEAHREEYEAYYLEPAIDFVETLGPRLKKLSPGIGYEGRKDGRGSNQRIHRDIRFSKDKTPYKDHITFYFWDGPDKKSTICGYYVRVEVDGTGMLAGAFGFEKATLDKYRQVVDKRGAQLQQVLDKVVGDGYRQLAESYARVPQGYPADHAHAELLKARGLAALSPRITPGQAASPGFLDLIEGYAAHLAPLNAWMKQELA
jgi:uncharacterized protein (TIGR02453 family)